MLRLANRDKLISEVVRLRKGGMKFYEIGKRMGIGRETARYLFKLRVPRTIRIAKPSGELPMMTMAGIFWQWPPVRPKGRGGRRV
jgi:predicted transcriptional regulator